jgi:uncharacterized protein YecE (DUF72 family)
MRLNARVGCSGWSYEDWVGSFYPEDARPKDYLRLYSRVFDCVEIDSTFYRVPSPSLVQHWYESTPPVFIFAPKIPKLVTHDQQLENVNSYMEHFIATIGQLREKLGPIVVQLPPSFRNPEQMEALAEFVTTFDRQLRYAIEFRHESWFRPEVEELLKANNICQVWSINQYLTTPATVTTDFIYLRFVGDRTINEFHRLQRDQSEVMKTWKSTLRDLGGSVRDWFIFFNNHFAGFGPGSVNEFRRLMGLAELDWSNLGHHGAQQKTLSEFSPSG